MVSLRGSKFGSRVAMLCCNPSYATRPGPGTGMQIGRFSNFGDDRFQMTGQSGGRFNRGSQWHPSYPPFRWRNSIETEDQKGVSSLRLRTVYSHPKPFEDGSTPMNAVFLWSFLQANGISWEAHQVRGSLFFFLYYCYFFGWPPFSLSFLFKSLRVGNGIPDYVPATEPIITWKMFSILPEYRS